MKPKEPSLPPQSDGASESQGKPGSFDAIMRQLQAIVERLERSDLALEDSLTEFERGIALSRQGQSILDAAEKKVEMLLEGGSTMPLDPEGGT